MPFLHKYFLVLAIPQEKPGKKCHPGGQLTAANGLVDYLDEHHINYRVLNTLATSYPPVPFPQKLLQSINRTFTACVWVLKGQSIGFLAFSSFGLSMYERVVISLVHRLYKRPSAIFFRSSEILDKAAPRYNLFALKFLLQCPSMVIVQGKVLATFLSSFDCKNVQIIPNWLPKGYDILSEPKQPPINNVVRFIFVGWLEPEKGVHELIDAIIQLESLSKLFEVTIAGNGSLESELISIINSRRLSNISYVGWVDRNQLSKLYEQSHVFLLPSHSEGFPNSLLEAMSFGLPSITTRVGAISDTVKNEVNGFLIDASDSQSLASSMAEYIQNPCLINKHSSEALLTAKSRHDRATNVAHLLTLLNIKI